MYPFYSPKTPNTIKTHLEKLTGKMVHGILSTHILHTFCANSVFIFYGDHIEESKLLVWTTPL